MPRYISPLHDTYIRFDAAAALLAKHYNRSTSHSLLEMLIIAMWSGRFNPPDLSDHEFADTREREDPENWLAVPIQKPRAQLTSSQLKLKPLPYEYYEAGRETVLSVMCCEGLLPGDHAGWHDLLKGANDPAYLHSKAEAFDALSRMPLDCYDAAARAFLGSLHIPRRMLQGWLDQRSSGFRGLLISEAKTMHQARPANDASAHYNKAKRGRPTLPAWDSIEVWAVKLNAQNPDMQRKQLAGLLYLKALEKFDEAAVPNETTILRRLSEFLNDPRPPFSGAA